PISSSRHNPLPPLLHHIDVPSLPVHLHVHRHRRSITLRSKTHLHRAACILGTHGSNTTTVHPRGGGGNSAHPLLHDSRARSKAQAESAHCRIAPRPVVELAAHVAPCSCPDAGCRDCRRHLCT